MIRDLISGAGLDPDSPGSEWWSLAIGISIFAGVVGVVVWLALYFSERLDRLEEQQRRKRP